MSARSIVVLVGTLLFASAAMAERPAPQKLTAVKAVAASPAIPLTLVSLFETSTEVTVTPTGAIIATPPPQVLVARVAKDGSIATACVASAEAAERFFASGRESQQTQTSKTQEK